MKLKLAIATFAACTMLSGTALADGPKHNKKQNRGQATSTSVTGGVTAAGPNGAVAGGVSGAQGTVQTTDRNRRTRMQVPSTASTNTSGSVYTTRDSGAAAINTGGAASGSGAVRSSSEGEVYSSTTRQGSEADAYGTSEAEADDPNRI